MLSDYIKEHDKCVIIAIIKELPVVKTCA